jgi:hypothetical protein
VQQTPPLGGNRRCAVDSTEESAGNGGDGVGVIATTHGSVESQAKVINPEHASSRVLLWDGCCGDR